MKRKLAKCLTACLLTAALLLPIAGCTEEKPQETPSEKRTDPVLDPVSESAAETVEEGPVRLTGDVTLSAMRLFVGESAYLHYDKIGDATDVLPVVWTSSSDCVTVLQNGKITAVKDGFAVISAGGEKNCTVCVLPLTPARIDITTKGGAAITSKEDYLACTVTVKNENEEYSFSNASAGIRIRGNSTANRPKKPYRIKFDQKQGLLGMNEGAKCKSWVLLAEYQDDSMIRNALSLTMGDVILNEYSSDFRYVSLYVNGSYQGVYLAAEQNQINKNRVNIPEATAEDGGTDAGFLYEMDASPPEEGKYLMNFSKYSIKSYKGQTYTKVTSQSLPAGYQYYSIKNDLTAGQRTYAEGYLWSVFRVIAEATYNNIYCYIDRDDLLNVYQDGGHTAEEVISAVLDVDAAARMYVLDELTANGDSYWKSFFMYLDLSETGTGKLTFCCPWDYDGAYVHWNSYNYKDPEKSFSGDNNVWFVMLLNHEWFRDKVAEIWTDVIARSNYFSNAFHLIDRVGKVYETEFAADATKWSRGQNQAVQAGKTYDWLEERIVWMTNTTKNYPKN